MGPAELDALAREVRNLARRVAELEAHMGHTERVAAPPAAGPIEQRPAGVPADAASLVPIVGRTLLGLAGAYLLRALTDGGSVSPRAGVAAGILYAMGWLVWAAHTPAGRRLETALHGLTSVLILSPLLWEATLRFHALSTWAAGTILVSFVIFGLAISWRKNLAIVATIATLAGLGTASALLMATHDVLPFTLAFLVIAAAVEASACLNHWLSERWLAAAAADLSVLLATWLVTNARGLPETYAPIPPRWLIGAQVGLLAIYLISTVVRTLFRGFTFTGFEIAQCAVAFTIALGGCLQLSTAAPRLAPAIGTLALAGATACYMVSLLRLQRQGACRRNLYTYSTFGILLALAGSRILFAGSADALWCVLAVACAGAGRFFGRMTLEVHAAVYLLLALTFSGAAQQAGALLLGSASWPGERQAALWMGAVAAVLAWALSDRRNSTVRLTMAAAAAWASAGIAAGYLTAACHYLLGPEASQAYCATLRTAALVGMALLLAWAGSRLHYPEFSRLIYPAMILGGYRLLAQDLHEERKVALFLSLLVYGAALTVVPRLKKAAS
jgi:hypothetical protein